LRNAYHDATVLTAYRDNYFQMQIVFPTPEQINTITQRPDLVGLPSCSCSRAAFPTSAVAQLKFTLDEWCPRKYLTGYSSWNELVLKCQIDVACVRLVDKLFNNNGCNNGPAADFDGCVVLMYSNFYSWASQDLAANGLCAYFYTLVDTISLQFSNSTLFTDGMLSAKALRELIQIEINSAILSVITQSQAAVCCFSALTL
jgi:hypothetical protein